MHAHPLQVRLAALVAMVALVTAAILAASTAQTGMKIQFLATMTLVAGGYVAFHLGLDLVQERLLARTLRR
jgi:hypothetical protein